MSTKHEDDEGISPFYFGMASNIGFRMMGKSGMLGSKAQKEAEEIETHQAGAFEFMLVVFVIYCILSGICALIGIDIWVFS